MTCLLEKFYRLRWWIFIALFVIGPFHAFFITWLKSGSEAGGLWISAIWAWREILVVLFILLVCAELIIKKHLPRFDALDWIVIGYVGICLAWLPFQTGRPAQWIFGMRFDAMPLVFFLAARQALWRAAHSFIAPALITASIVIIFGLLHALVLPQNFLMNFGYSNQQGEYDPSLAISACQHLENTSVLCRATSTFASPMRYGSYLLLIIGLVLPLLFRKSKMRAWLWILFASALSSVFLTYSRAYWIGAIAIFIAFSIVGIRKIQMTEKTKRLMKFVASACAICAIIIIITVFFALKNGSGWTPSVLKNIFVRGSSTSQHWLYLREGINTSLKNPFGLGLGKAGPASIYFDEKFVTENWYLQIAAEIGIFGALLFIAVLFLMAKRLFEKGEIGIFLCVAGIAAAGLFMHSFEETTVSLLLFGLAGIKLSRISEN